MFTRKLIYWNLFFLLAFAAFLHAEEENSFLQSELSLKAGGAIGIFEPWLCSGLQYDLAILDWFGVGAELGLHYGPLYKDLHSTAFLLVKLSRFYVGGGISYEIRDSIMPPDSEYDAFATPSRKINPAVTMGVNVPLFQLGPGHLGVNPSLDWFVTDIPMKSLEYQDEGFFAYIVRQFFSAIGQVLTGVVMSGKFGVEMTYSYTF